MSFALCVVVLNSLRNVLINRVREKERLYNSIIMYTNKDVLNKFYNLLLF